MTDNHPQPDCDRDEKDRPENPPQADPQTEPEAPPTDPGDVQNPGRGGGG